MPSAIEQLVDQAEEARDDTFAAVAEVNAAKDFVVNASNGILAAGQSAINAQVAANASAVQAAASAVAASDSANEAEGSNQSAYNNFLLSVDAKSQAEAARNAAQAASSLASGYAVNSSQSADQALGYRNTAQSSAATATTKAGEASASASQAYSHSQSAASSAQAASNSAFAASASAQAAEAVVNSTTYAAPLEKVGNDVRLSSADDGYTLRYSVSAGAWQKVPHNPFNQSLNTGSSAQFADLSVSGNGAVNGDLSVGNQISLGAVGSLTQGTLTLSEGSTPMVVSHEKITFPDLTEQTTAAVSTPDASTTVKGKVELATDAEAVAGASTTLAVTPENVRRHLMSHRYRPIPIIGWLSAASGTGAAASQSVFYPSLVTSNVGVAGNARLTALPGIPSRGKGVAIFNWDKQTLVTFRWEKNNVADLAHTVIFSLGKNVLAWPGYGDLTVKGMAVKLVGSDVILQVHNGTTLTNVVSSFSFIISQVTDFLLYSDGLGNVQLFVNDNLVASTSAGPTGNSLTNCFGLAAEVDSTSASVFRMTNYVNCVSFWHDC